MVLIFEKAKIIEIQEHGPIESRYFSGFFVLSVQVLVPSQVQELVPIAVKEKNIVRANLATFLFYRYKFLSTRT
jgi:hypothetical protein